MVYSKGRGCMFLHRNWSARFDERAQKMFCSVNHSLITIKAGLNMGLRRLQEMVVELDFWCIEKSVPIH